MTFGSTLPQKGKFDEYVKIGLIRSQTNDDQMLTIYVYSEFTQYERLWNSVTRQARGLVLDNNGRCIVRCLPKFFNSDEPEALAERPRDIDPSAIVVQDKVDGSLIQVANDVEHGLVVTSKGSFNSNQARWARELLNELGYEFLPGLTYIFELIHPDNHIVINYGGRRELVLLAIIENDTGKEHNVYLPRFDGFNRVPKVDATILSNINALNASGLREGVVANFGGYRAKYKTDEYVRLHRIVTDFTPKRVWEALSSGDSLDFADMPEEFQSWLDETVAQYMDAFSSLDAEIKVEFERATLLSDKELGLSTEFKHKGMIFMLRNGRDVSTQIWKQIRPRKEVIYDKTINA